MAAQTFEGADLRKHVFSRANLSGADFRSADLRGADLEGCDLRGADFSGARTGMRPSWAVLLALTGIACSVIAGAAAGYAARFLQELIRSGVPLERMLGVYLAASLLFMLIVAAIRGPYFAATRVLPFLSGLTLAGAVVAVLGKSGTGKGALAALGFFVVTLAIIVFAAAARSVAGAVGSLFFVVAAVTGALMGASLGGGLTAALIALAAVIIGQRGLRGHAEFHRLRNFSAWVASRGGTSFRNANLRGATFRSTRLAACDFRGAVFGAVDLSGAELHLCLFDRGREPKLSRRRPVTKGAR